LGFARFAADSRIAGCIVNRVASESHYRSVAREVERAAGLPCLGFLPEDRRCGLGERHLGLEFAPGNLEAEARIVAVADAIADSLEAHVDLDALLAIASRAPGLDEPEAPPAAATRTRIAVSRDEAFWFLYEDNLDTLRSLGAELAFFSPLRDRALPEDCSALYLCGGFPELYGDAIEANSPLRDAIRAQAARGMPVFAECGGYMYLLEGFDAPGGTAFSGCGVFAGRARFPGGLSALGYRTARLRRDGPLGRAGSELKGHVFHYSTASGDGALETRSPDSTRIALEGSCAANAFGSFLHVHFAGNPDAARAFVDAAVAFDGA
jgi:cobyrinic acid a,c-diamide synthase